MEKILLPTDLSRQSRMMIGCMPELKRFGVEKVILFHVHITGAPLDSFVSESLEDHRRRLEEDGYDSELQIVYGTKPSEEILKAVKENDVDTIVMPSSGKGRATHLLVGSTSLSVMKAADVKVFLKRFVKGQGGDICEACPLTFLRTVVALPPLEQDKGFMYKVNDLVAKGQLENVLLLNPVSGDGMEYSKDSLLGPQEVHERLGTAGNDVASMSAGTLEAISRESATLLVIPGCMSEPMGGILRETPMGRIVHNTRASILIIPNV